MYHNCLSTQTLQHPLSNVCFSLHSGNALECFGMLCPPMQIAVPLVVSYSPSVLWSPNEVTVVSSLVIVSSLVSH